MYLPGNQFWSTLEANAENSEERLTLANFFASWKRCGGEVLEFAAAAQVAPGAYGEDRLSVVVVVGRRERRPLEPVKEEEEEERRLVA